MFGGRCWGIDEPERREDARRATVAAAGRKGNREGECEDSLPRDGPHAVASRHLYISVSTQPTAEPGPAHGPCAVPDGSGFRPLPPVISTVCIGFSCSCWRSTRR